MSAPTAERAAEAARAIRSIRCDCFDPDLAEFYGDEPCARCRALTLLGADDD